MIVFFRSRPKESHWQRCSWCADKIPATASVCRQCRNFQGWRYFARLLLLSTPWITAAVVLFPLAKSSWHDYSSPLADDISYYSIITDHTLSMKITNEHDRPIFITGSYFFCNRIVAPDAENYLKKDLVSPSFGTLEIDPHKDKVVYHKLDKKDEAAIADKFKACRVSALIEDYYGKSAIVSTPVIPIEIEGTYTSPSK